MEKVGKKKMMMRKAFREEEKEKEDEQIMMVIMRMKEEWLCLGVKKVRKEIHSTLSRHTHAGVNTIYRCFSL